MVNMSNKKMHPEEQERLLKELQSVEFNFEKSQASGARESFKGRWSENYASRGDTSRFQVSSLAEQACHMILEESDEETAEQKGAPTSTKAARVRIPMVRKPQCSKEKGSAGKALSRGRHKFAKPRSLKVMNSQETTSVSIPSTLASSIQSPVINRFKYETDSDSCSDTGVEIASRSVEFKRLSKRLSSLEMSELEKMQNYVKQIEDFELMTPRAEFSKSDIKQEENVESNAEPEEVKVITFSDWCRLPSQREASGTSQAVSEAPGQISGKNRRESSETAQKPSMPQKVAGAELPEESLCKPEIVRVSAESLGRDRCQSLESCEKKDVEIEKMIHEDKTAMRGRENIMGSEVVQVSAWNPPNLAEPSDSSKDSCNQGRSQERISNPEVRTSRGSLLTNIELAQSELNLTHERTPKNGRTDEELLEERKRELVGREVVGVLRKHQTRYFVIWHDNKYAGVHISGKNVEASIGSARDGELVVVTIEGLGPGFQKWHKQHPYTKSIRRATEEDTHRLSVKYQTYSAKLLSGVYDYDPRTGKTFRPIQPGVKPKSERRSRTQTLESARSKPGLLDKISEEAKANSHRAGRRKSLITSNESNSDASPGPRRVFGRWSRARQEGLSGVPDTRQKPKSGGNPALALGPPAMNRSQSTPVYSPRARAPDVAVRNSLPGQGNFYAIESLERGRSDNAMGGWRSSKVSRSGRSSAASVTYPGTNPRASVGSHRSRASTGVVRNSMGVVVAPTGDDRTTNRGTVINIVGGEHERARKSIPKDIPESRDSGTLRLSQDDLVKTAPNGHITQVNGRKIGSSKKFDYSNAMDARRARIEARKAAAQGLSYKPPRNSGPDRVSLPLVSDAVDLVNSPTIQKLRPDCERISAPKGKFVEVLPSGCLVTYQGVLAKPPPFPTELAQKIYGTEYEIVG